MIESQQARMELITVVYRLGCSAAEIESVSRDVAYEQTVELPPHLITSAHILENVVGRVRSIEPEPERNAFRVTVDYPASLAGKQIPQLLNLIFGNISMKRNVRVVDLQLPDSLLNHFPGPRYGLQGIRRLLGVYGRPLLSTALKPQGASVAELAAMAGEFAFGGGDIVKDDHNLHDESLSAFRERVLKCFDAVQFANSQTGGHTLYFPNISCPAEELDERLELLVAQGVPGILIAPFTMGPDVVRSIARKHPLVIMAHPTLSGAYFHDHKHGIDPGLLLGTIFRLIGCDISVYPNVGGRFTFSEAECLGIADRLRESLGNLAPAWPAPAGGMRYETLPQLCEQYGPDAAFLIGGALLGHSKSLRDSTRAFLERIESRYPTRREPPRVFQSACEFDARDNGQNGSQGYDKQALIAAVMQHIPFQDDYQWEGRDPTAYKPSHELPFRNVSRVELIGRTGEETAFDLRYFQIEPGGFTSLEKHEHTHTVICVRGAGTLRNGDKEFDLKQLDVAYVPPLAVHQLRNDSDEPFGFFCIVDRERDRPQPVE